MVKKSKEEIILEIFSTFDHILTKDMLKLISKIWYVKFIKYIRYIFIPFNYLFLYKNFKNHNFIKLQYIIYLFSVLCLNGSYLGLIFLYDTFVYDYIMNTQLEYVMLNYY
uniref:Uncharacterized protein orf109 n=1 Tax=Heterostelium pallidum TaxID=13642 RepID=Q5ILK1_HETPA|nr:hypothetical protein PopaoMp23 [Heterostelium pallidum]AAU00609.1 unknown [Heterostelium pallidum]